MLRPHWHQFTAPFMTSDICPLPVDLTNGINLDILQSSFLVVSSVLHVTACIVLVAMNQPTTWRRTFAKFSQGRHSKCHQRKLFLTLQEHLLKIHQQNSINTYVILIKIVYFVEATSELSSGLCELGVCYSAMFVRNSPSLERPPLHAPHGLFLLADAAIFFHSSIHITITYISLLMYSFSTAKLFSGRKSTCALVR